jgi:mRNA (guanine-N7-)-methyltransferase
MTEPCEESKTTPSFPIDITTFSENGGEATSFGLSSKPEAGGTAFPERSTQPTLDNPTAACPEKPSKLEQKETLSSNEPIASEDTVSTLLSGPLPRPDHTDPLLPIGKFCRSGKEDSTSILSAKRPRTDNTDSKHSTFRTSLIAEHYNARPNPDFVARKSSSILHLRNLNNWIKSVLINQYVRPNDNVMDFCCGKGGDLLKYIAAKIGYLVGVDIAEKSIEHFKERYHSSHVRAHSSGAVFPVQLFAADCFQESISDRIDPEIQFQAVSCQFALHYAFEKEDKLRQALKNITERLGVGGYFFATLPDANVILKKLEREISQRQGLRKEEICDFMKARDLFPITLGNSAYSITFGTPPALDSPYGQQYVFELRDAIDSCPEYLVHFPTLSSLAKNYGLECIYRKSFHSFFYYYCDHPLYHNLIHRLKVFVDGQPPSADEWEVAYLYFICVFRKVSGH